MATKAGNDDLDDFLTCSICLEKFNIPKYLPCLHTFCECCIETYITSGLEKGETHSFQCPVCRCIVPAPNENCNAVEWAKKLPVNFLIVGLLEKEKVKRPEKRCMSCERIGVQTEAAFICVECSDTLCNACYKCHMSNKASASHKIMSIYDISTNEKMLNVFQNLCSVHANEKLKLYCVDHDLPCCSMCVSITHRKCEAIVSIEEMGKKIASTKIVESIEAELSNCSEDVTTVITHNKDFLQDLNDQFNTSAKKLEEECKVLIDEVKMFETTRKSELQKKFDLSKDEIETRLIEFENRRKALENDIHILKVSKTEASEVQVMLECKRILRQLEQHKSFIETRAVNCNTKFKLTFENVDNVVKEIQVKLENMCKVSVEKVRTELNLGIVKNTKSLETLKINRFQSINSDGWGINVFSVNAICFQVSEDVQLEGFLTYECVSSKPHVTLSLKQGSITLAEVTQILDGTNAENNIISVKLQSPVKLKSETKYDIVLKTNEPSCLTFFVYGLSGQDEVKCADVIFKFENSLLDYDAGNTPKQGQIPGILFQKIN